MAACGDHAASHLLDVAKHRQTMQDLALLFSFAHRVFLSRKNPTVDDFRPFWI